MRPFREEIEKYLFARINILSNGCWEWTGYRNHLSYAMGNFQRRVWTMTRLVYCATQGGFDPQLDICHTCDNPPCVSPLHLWLGSRAANIMDSVDKGRHFLSTITHCKRGHELSGNNLRIGNDGKRVCTVCEMGRHRLRAGWPVELAFTLPPQQLGYRPPGLAIGGPKKNKGPKTHCVNGHPLEGDNLYVVPSDGRRQCRTCKLHVIQRLSAERRQSNG